MVEAPGFVARLPLRRQAWKPGLDLLPGRVREQGLQARSRPAVLARTCGIPGPAAATGDAGLEPPMAAEAQHLEIVLAVVTTLEDGNLVMYLEGSLLAAGPAELATAAASGDERPAPRLGEWPDRGPFVVGVAKPHPQAAPADQWRARSGTSIRAFETEHHQVGSRVRSRLLDAKDLQRPRPLQPARLAGAARPALDDEPDGRCDGHPSDLIHAAARPILALGSSRFPTGGRARVLAGPQPGPDSSCSCQRRNRAR